MRLSLIIPYSFKLKKKNYALKNFSIYFHVKLKPKSCCMLSSMQFKSKFYKKNPLTKYY